ncbi:hypothetical protein [Photobacterium kishitanii]|nr:hypothetical protein [Photobacterium kishitanii]
MFFKKGLIAVALLSTISGCSSMDPDRLCLPSERIEMNNAEVPIVPNKDRKIIVLPVDIPFPESAAYSLKAVILNELEATITGIGGHVVDRKLASKLKNEIKLAEQSGRYNTNGVPIADIAVITEVTASNLSYSFEKERKRKTKDGETKYYPSKCEFDVDVKAITKVISLPDMSLLERIEFSGSDSSSTETRDSDCPISQAKYVGMTNEAATNAIKHSFDLQKMLAPIAPVIELRQCSAGSMVKIGMGSNRKIRPGSDIIFSQIYKNELGEIETYTIGEGNVVDIENDGIKPTFSWVAIEEDLSLKLRRGDAAKIVPGCSPLMDSNCTVGMWLDL